jgi:hypothetical protein
MANSIIDGTTLAAAERLFGIEYTDAERAQMLDNLADQIELAARRRAMKLPNSLPPATVFDPRTPAAVNPAMGQHAPPSLQPDWNCPADRVGDRHRGSVC